MSHDLELRLVGVDQPPPPPIETLLAALGEVRPVAPRHRLAAAAWTALGPLLVTALTLTFYPLRGDWRFLPGYWKLGVAGLWIIAAASLLTALVPPRRQLLPDLRRLIYIVVGGCLAVIGVGLGLTIDAPGHTLLPTRETLLHSSLHCLGFALRFALPGLLLSAFALARALPVGRAWIGATIGAAGGAMAGFVLHLVCPYGGALHAGLAHGGGVVAAALLGALALPSLLRLSDGLAWRRLPGTGQQRGQ